MKRRRRPVLFLLRQIVGSPLLRLGDRIEGDFRFECDGVDDDDGYRTRCRRVPASWSSEAAENVKEASHGGA